MALFEQTSLPYYSQYIHKSRYARWRDDLGRRETWPETVERLIDFWKDRFPLEMSLSLSEEENQPVSHYLKDAIINLEIMPSMRTMMTAGEALNRDEMAAYNCAYLSIKGAGPALDIMTEEMKTLGFDEPIHIQLKYPTVFDEIFYVLLCGTGVGFSVERQFVNSLPTVGKPLNRVIYHKTNKAFPGIPKEELSSFDKKSNTITVADSKYGWASSLRILITELYNGNTSVKWNLSLIRPAGSILKTFGGRASGPKPLDDLFNYVVALFKGAIGRKLTSIECHGLVCKIASVVVVGGVRRSALISLSNLSDERMRYAKSGDWWIANPEFAIANNSAVYTDRPNAETFMREWLSLIESKSGERGIFNRNAAKQQLIKNGRRNPDFDFGTNPCSEIILRNKQNCNLTEVVIREKDTFNDLKRKIKLATILGTLQSTLSNFRYVSAEWKRNAEEERLLGVSLTGIMDHKIMSGQAQLGDNWFDGSDYPTLESILEELKQESINTNIKWAKILKIAPSAGITTGKPSGTVSQLVDSASGGHARHAKFYLRSVRNDKKDPIAQFMKDSGIPWEEDLMNPENVVFYFPIKAPESSLTRHDVSAINQLKIWKLYQDHYTEHKPSVTITVKDHEWIEVGAWVYENFDNISGVSFLPAFDHVYKQAPYQDLTEEEYNEWMKKMPSELNWDNMAKYEFNDNTVGLQEYACSAGFCEI